jgi:putative membrane protein
MNKTLVSFGICLILAVPACAPPSVGERTGVNAVAGISPSTRDFVTEAASSDMFEIQSSQLAAQRSDPPTRAFASTMISDHQRTTAELMSMVNSGALNVQMPATMTPSHRAMIDRLQNLDGPDFTKRYHEAQVLAHKDAVSLYQRYASGGENPALKTWAGRTIPALQHHLEMAEQLNK